LSHTQTQPSFFIKFIHSESFESKAHAELRAEIVFLHWS